MIAVERYSGTPRLMVPAFGARRSRARGYRRGRLHGPARHRAQLPLAFTYWVGIAVAAIIMVAIFHTAKAKWTTVLRRAMETMAVSVPIFAVLFIGSCPEPQAPVPLGAAAPSWPRSSARWSCDHLAHKQHGYLNLTFFFVRQVIYFGVWIFVSQRLYSWSTQQDENGRAGLTVKQRFLSPGALPFLALTITFAAFDWMMSLTPLWQSTIYGVYYFAGSFLAAFCVLTLATVNAQGTRTSTATW